MHRLIFAKIVQHSAKCQATDLIFSLLCKFFWIILCKNLYDHMLCIFTPINFTRIQQLIKIKQEDHITSMFTVGLIFLIARACQHKTSKIQITILSFSQLKLCILQDINYFTSTYLAQFNSPRKYPKQYISYFYQILHFNMKATKLCSPHLGTPRLRYEFLKHAFKSRKINQKIKTSHRLTAEARGQRDPPINETKTGDGADW